MTEGILNTVKDLLHSAFDSFDTMAMQACDVLTGNTVTSMWWYVTYFFRGTFVLFCNIIIGICMLIELSKIFSKVDVLKWEHGLKVGVKVVLAKVCVDQAPDFLKACYRQCTNFITHMKNGGYGTDIDISDICADVIDPYIDGVSGLGNAIGLLVSVLLLQIGIKICGVLVAVMAYGRIFEILVYVIISPIPCAFLPLGEGDNLSRIPMKFFKNYIAVCLQGVMMYVCIKLFGSLLLNSFQTKVNGTLSSGVSNSVMVSDLCYDMLLFTIVLVMSITKCSSWAKSIMDAG
ncbi:MAG: hypothetical protein E7290_10210 [Lachnospiraceae bacterium]|nr:hypothetical protein [Lachnospiraceae bacterium]